MKITPKGGYEYSLISKRRPFEAMLKIGARAPNFILPDAGGADVVLSDFKGKWVLLFFYPADFTRVCVKEVCAFRDDLEQFEERGVQLIGINFYSPSSHGKFAARHGLTFPLLWDRQKRVARRYNALGLMGLYCKRAYFLVSPRGWIAYARSVFPMGRLANQDLFRVIDRCLADESGLPYWIKDDPIPEQSGKPLP